MSETKKEIELKEVVAALAHDQWSGWMDYLFSKCINYFPDTIQAEEGALIIPKWAVDRWKKQARTPYTELSPAEMDSDRKEADKFLAVFNSRQPEQGLVEAIEDALEIMDEEPAKETLKQALTKYKGDK